jgi:hypothetical protein
VDAEKENAIPESEITPELAEKPEVVAHTAEESEEDLPWCVVNVGKGGA